MRGRGGGWRGGRRGEREGVGNGGSYNGMNEGALNVHAFLQSMSGSCSKVLFWPTPYACRSEHTSCIHAAGNKFYDFTPLHANTGEKAWRIQHRYTSIYTSLCKVLLDIIMYKYCCR